MNSIPKEAILKPGEWLSYYNQNDEYSDETRTELVSSNGKYSLGLNSMGGGCIRIKNSDGKFIWASDTKYLRSGMMSIAMIPLDILIMEENGNLVLCKQSNNEYDGKGNIKSNGKREEVFWQTNTTGKGNYAVLEDNGSLVVYNTQNQKLWSSS